jgi:hypothetical protein
MSTSRSLQTTWTSNMCKEEIKAIFNWVQEMPCDHASLLIAKVNSVMGAWMSNTRTLFLEEKEECADVDVKEMQTHCTPMSL